MRKKSRKRIYAIIVTAVMAISSIVTPFNEPVYVAAEDTTLSDSQQKSESIEYVKWTVPEALIDGTSYIGTSTVDSEAALTVITADGGNTAPVYNNGSAFRLGAQNMGADNAYYLFTLNPTGKYENYKLSFSMGGSNTCAKEWVFAYSTDGSNYKNMEEIFTIDSSKATVPCSIAIPADANSSDKLYIRLAPKEGTGRIDGKEGNLAGNHYLDKAEDKAITITADLASGDAGSEEPEPEEPEKPQISTIASVKAAANGEFTVQGTVLFVDGKNVYVEDATGGICLRFDSVSDAIIVGKKVTATGTYATFRGCIQLESVKEADCIIEEGTLPEANVKTIAEINADYGTNTLQSTRIKIEKAKIGAINSTGNTVLTQGADTINIYKCPAVNGIKEGDTVDVTAIVGAFDAVQLRVVNAEDIQKASDDSSTDTPSNVEIDEEIDIEYAKWAGPQSTLPEGETKYYNTLPVDKNAFLTIDMDGSTKSPIFSTVGGTGTNYRIGMEKMQSSWKYLCALSPDGKYGNYKITISMSGTKASAKDWILSYSIDGKQFTSITKFVIEEEKKEADYSAVIPAVSNGSKQLYIQLAPAPGTTTVGGATFNNSGNNYVSRIIVSANPVISDDICQAVKCLPKAGEITTNQPITLSSRTENAVIKYRVNDGEEKVYKEPFTLTEEELQNKATITAYAQKDDLVSIETSTSYTWIQTGTVKAAPNGGAVAVGKEIQLTCETEGATIQYSEDQNNWTACENNKLAVKELPKTYYFRAVKDGYKPSAAIECKYTERSNEKYNIYFGQLHSHTSYSDGAGTCEEAYQYASNIDGLDFVAVTDHSNSFDHADTASILDGSVSEEWKEGRQLAEKYTTDTFVSIFGYEMTWSNGLGHMNTFNSEGFQSRTQSDFSTYSTALQNYYGALESSPNSISQFNHPGTTFGDFSDFAHYSEERDNLITTIEVGNGEGAIGSSGYFPSYEYYQRALDKGWHVAPTNNQDNHKGKWGNANTGRSVVLADTLTIDNIYDAMRNYRVYATEDADLSIYYTLDGNEMGTILSKGQTGDIVKIKAELEDGSGDDLGKIQVISQGGQVVAEKTLTGSKEVVELDIENKYSFYYLKIVESDGDIAVTAPVWVDEVIAAGVSGISTDEVLPVKGQELTVNLGLYNNEAKPMIIDSIKFYIGDEEIHTADLTNLASVDSFGTAEYSFNYTCNKTGKIQIDAIVNGTINGVPIKSNASLDLTYVLEEMITKVIIDGTHYNDYVTGYYGGRVGNFTKIAGDQSVRVEVVKDKITKEMLESCSLLIISAPAKRSGTDNAGAYEIAHFEDDFLAMVKEYTDAGGTLIVCGIADYQDREEGQTTTEINKLLNTIGATTELYSDEAYDEVNNGGQPYRLYLKDFNAESKYLKNAVADEKDENGNIINEGQTYSAYSGCTVKLNEEAVAAGKAEALIKGHDTTYSINTKDDDGKPADSAVVVEKGNTVMLAHEELSSGANIFVAGTVFISDFEVKAELDNIWDLPYLNRTIVENILNDVAVKVEPTKIAEVRKNGQMGDVYAIEGYVTAGTSIEGNTFFDAIYVQDDTAGITVFPYSVSGLEIGTKVRITGYVDAYQGDKEIQVLQSEILAEEEKKIYEPEKLSAKDAMDYEKSGGKLVQVQGKVVDALYDQAGTGVSQFWLDDGSGENANIFIDGYILSATTQKNELASIVKVGEWVSAVGIVYAHPEGESDIPITCLRVRNCDEIQASSAPEEPKPEDPKPEEPKPEDPKPENPKPDDSNNGSNGGGTWNGGGSSSGSNNNNTPTEDTTTKPPTENDNNQNQKPNTSTEIKEDGTKVETTTEEKEDGTVKKTVVETKTDGSKKETITETKIDGSVTETKKITTADKSATLQTVTQTNAAGNANTNAVIRTGVAKEGTIAITKDLFEEAVQSGNMESLVIEISGQTITSTTPKKVNTVITVTVPEAEKASIDKLVLTKDGMAAAKASQKGLKVSLNNTTVTIPVKQLAKADASLEEFDISVEVEKASEATVQKQAIVSVLTKSKGSKEKACIISFAENKEAAKVGMKAEIPVTKEANVAGKDTVYIYKYNANTGKLVEIANSKQTVSADGTVTVEAVSGTNYLVSAKKLSGKNVKTIKDSIKVSVAKNTVKNGKSIKVNVSLPNTVSTKNKFAAAKATISYQSSNKKIATVSSKGVIKAKNKGSVTITTTIKLESGQKVTNKKKITVK